MGIARYLAMTEDEFSSTQQLPEHIAWMACHFSPYHTSLSNLPTKLPPNSLLILNDSTPPDHQDPENIAETINLVLKEQEFAGLLLDFQRPKQKEAEEIVRKLLTLDFPVCVSLGYAEDLDCPIFLPPLPLTLNLAEYIAPWSNRKIWLDTALSCERITVTKNGSTFSTVSAPPECTLVDNKLHCHYQITVDDDSVIFTLCRTKEDLEDLLAEADALGIEVAVGLYQELK